MIRIIVLFAAACSVASALPTSPVMSRSHGVVARQPFRPNRMEPAPVDVTFKRDVMIPDRGEDTSVEKEAKLHFAEVLSEIESLGEDEEAQSGEKGNSLERYASKRSMEHLPMEEEFLSSDEVHSEEEHAGPRPVGVRSQISKRLEAPTSATPAKPTKPVSEGETEEEDSKASSVEGQHEQMCAITLEMLVDLPFEKFIPVAKHVDVHGHVNGVAGEVIIGEKIFPVAGAIGVVPCKELQKKLQQIHHHKSVEREMPIMNYLK